MRVSNCQQVMTFFPFFCIQFTARLKLQFQSGTPLFKSLDPPLSPPCVFSVLVVFKDIVNKGRDLPEWIFLPCRPPVISQHLLGTELEHAYTLYNTVLCTLG